MTLQEKAKELINKMFNCDKSTPEESMAMLYPHAKQCAAISVDEILGLPSMDDGRMIVVIKEDYDFWKQVKQEIEQL